MSFGDNAEPESASLAECVYVCVIDGSVFVLRVVRDVLLLRGSLVRLSAGLLRAHSLLLLTSITSCIFSSISNCDWPGHLWSTTPPWVSPRRVRFPDPAPDTRARPLAASRSKNPAPSPRLPTLALLCWAVWTDVRWRIRHDEFSCSRL